MAKLLRGKTFLFFISALIIILWYSADKEQRTKVLELRSIENFRANPAVKNQESSALNFAQKFAKHRHGPSIELVRTLLKENEPINGTIYHFQQVWTGYPVYESQLTIQWSKEELQFQALQNNLKTINEATVNSRYSQEEIIEVLKDTYKQFHVLEPIEKQILVREGFGELTYKMIIELPSKETREILISAVTSEIRVDQKKTP